MKLTFPMDWRMCALGVRGVGTLAIGIFPLWLTAWRRWVLWFNGTADIVVPVAWAWVTTGLFVVARGGGTTTYNIQEWNVNKIWTMIYQWLLLKLSLINN